MTMRLLDAIMETLRDIKHPNQEDYEKRLWYLLDSHGDTDYTRHCQDMGISPSLLRGLPSNDQLIDTFAGDSMHCWVHICRYALRCLIQINPTLLCNYFLYQNYFLFLPNFLSFFWKFPALFCSCIRFIHDVNIDSNGINSSLSHIVPRSLARASWPAQGICGWKPSSALAEDVSKINTCKTITKNTVA